jgi:hypothetical protein
VALFDRPMEGEARRWPLAAGWRDRDGLINDYLGYLADRGYSPQTVRAYAFDLLAFARWLAAERLALGEVPPMWCCVTWRTAGGRCCRDARAATRTPSGTAQRRLCACDDQPSAGRCVRPIRLPGDAGPGCAQPHPASRRGTPGICRGAQRAAGPPGPAETALWPAGPRAAAVAPRPGPREPAALLASFRTD